MLRPWGISPDRLPSPAATTPGGRISGSPSRRSTAADPAAFPEQITKEGLQPFRVARLFQGGGSGTGIAALLNRTVDLAQSSVGKRQFGGGCLDLPGLAFQFGRIGADLLGLAARIGSLEPGKQADLIRVSLADPRVQPVWDVYATLVFAAAPEDVRDVMVSGRWLMRDRQVLTLEAPRVLADVFPASWVRDAALILAVVPSNVCQRSIRFDYDCHPMQLRMPRVENVSRHLRLPRLRKSGRMQP